MQVSSRFFFFSPGYERRAVSSPFALFFSSFSFFLALLRGGCIMSLPSLGIIDSPPPPCFNYLSFPRRKLTGGFFLGHRRGVPFVPVFLHHPSHEYAGWFFSPPDSFGEELPSVTLPVSCLYGLHYFVIFSWRAPLFFVFFDSDYCLAPSQEKLKREHAPAFCPPLIFFY